ncbi:MAG TPA: hypothetical protein VNF07_05635 [Acidimicrobiales bacterium]|nr:hypothetical protein [Acidimicrobiales bacterium]
MRLRGASVDVDLGRLARVAIALMMAGALALALALTVAGANKNAQITALRTRGLAVPIRVTGCLGLLGGSGSNAAGYACRGVYRFDGHRYAAAIPGNSLHPPGSTLQAVVVAGTPPLLTTASVLAGEHASARVFLAPAVIVLVLAVAALGLRRRQVARFPSARRARTEDGGV